MHQFRQKIGWATSWAIFSQTCLVTLDARATQWEEIFGNGGRVARWHIFRPKILIWANLGGTKLNILFYYRAIWSILGPFGKFCGLWVYFMAIWYIFPVLVCFVPRKIWQP
jgi:hypothetical protein